MSADVFFKLMVVITVFRNKLFSRLKITYRVVTAVFCGEEASRDAYGLYLSILSPCARS